MFLKLCQLALAMAKAGTFAWGGAQALIPFFHADCVEKYKWMTEEHFGELVAADNALPGVFAIKLAAMIGWEVAGIAGMLVAVTALSAPSVLMFLVFFKFIQHHREKAWVNSMLNGLQYGAAGLIAFAILKVIPAEANRGSIRAFAMGLCVMALVFAVLYFKWLTPAKAMVGAAFLGIMMVL